MRGPGPRDLKSGTTTVTRDSNLVIDDFNPGARIATRRAPGCRTPVDKNRFDNGRGALPLAYGIAAPWAAKTSWSGGAGRQPVGWRRAVLASTPGAIR